MPIVTYRGEANVSEVADKVYSRLTPRQREKAEAALLKANPQLGKVNKLKTGTILKVPDLPELRAKTNRKLENPEDQIAKGIATSLEGFSKGIAKSFDVEKEVLKDQASLIKSAKFKNSIVNDREMEAVAKSTSTNIGNRSRELEDRKKKTEASLKSVAADLKKAFL